MHPPTTESLEESRNDRELYTKECVYIGLYLKTKVCMFWDARRLRRRRLRLRQWQWHKKYAIRHPKRRANEQRSLGFTLNYLQLVFGRWAQAGSRPGTGHGTVGASRTDGWFAFGWKMKRKKNHQSKPFAWKANPLPAARIVGLDLASWHLGLVTGKVPWV